MDGSDETNRFIDWLKGVAATALCLVMASLPEREWDDANGYKQNQVTGASKKMGFNRGVSVFFFVNPI